MPDGVTYAKQCLAFCLLISIKQKASMSHRTWQKKQQSFFLLTPTILILHEMIWDWIGVGFRYGTAGMLFLVHVLYKVHQSFLYPSASSWSLHLWLLYLFYLSWAPPFLPAITYQHNLKTNHKNKDNGATSALSFFTVNQTPECRESLWNGSIHLQTYMWSDGNIQNTQGAFNSKEQMIWFLNEWRTWVDIFPKEYIQREASIQKVFNTSNDHRKSNQNQNNVGIVPHACNATTQEAKAGGLPQV